MELEGNGKNFGGDSAIAANSDVRVTANVVFIPYKV